VPKSILKKAAVDSTTAVAAAAAAVAAGAGRCDGPAARLIRASLSSVSSASLRDSLELSKNQQRLHHVAPPADRQVGYQ